MVENIWLFLYWLFFDGLPFDVGTCCDGALPLPGRVVFIEFDADPTPVPDDVTADPDEVVVVVEVVGIFGRKGLISTLQGPDLVTPNKRSTLLYSSSAEVVALSIWTKLFWVNEEKRRDINIYTFINKKKKWLESYCLDIKISCCLLFRLLFYSTTYFVYPILFYI